MLGFRTTVDACTLALPAAILFPFFFFFAFERANAISVASGPLQRGHQREVGDRRQNKVPTWSSFCLFNHVKPPDSASPIFLFDTLHVTDQISFWTLVCCGLPVILSRTCFVRFIWHKVAKNSTVGVKKRVWFDIPRQMHFHIASLYPSLEPLLNHVLPFCLYRHNYRMLRWWLVMINTLWLLC